MKIKSLTIFILFFHTLFAQLTVADISYHPDFDSTKFPFFHGVASGDADTSSVIIWTKITPEKMQNNIKIRWFVATDSNFTRIVKQGVTQARKEEYFTVKILVNGLKSNSFYYYRFYALGKYSQFGLLRTMPSEKDSVRELKIAVITGSNYNAGYFNVYREIAKRKDIDFVFHTGDYIYEYGTNKYGANPERGLKPDKELISEQDYEMRYSHYRLDKDLQAAHRWHTWYVIWDDHESANNSWKNGAQNHQPATEGSWQKRKLTAQKTYFRWLPIRDNPDFRIYRAFSAGKLAKFVFLDTRLEGRQNEKLPLYDSTKTLMSEKQWNWLFSQLKNAKNYDWIFIVQQVMFSPLTAKNKIFNTDQWDGYPLERKKLLNFIKKHQIQNLVIISGDLHTSLASEVPFDKKTYRHNIDSTIACSELMAPSVSSEAVKGLKALAGKIYLKFYNPHIKFINFSHRGFLLITIKKNMIKAQWNLINSAKTRRYKISRKKTLFLTKQSKKINKKYPVKK